MVKTVNIFKVLEDVSDMNDLNVVTGRMWINTQKKTKEKIEMVRETNGNILGLQKRDRWNKEKLFDEME